MSDSEQKRCPKSVKDVLLSIGRMLLGVFKVSACIMLLWLPLVVSVMLAVETTPLCHSVIHAGLITTTYLIGCYSFVLNIVYTLCLVIDERDIGNFILVQRCISTTQVVLILGLACFMITWVW